METTTALDALIADLRGILGDDGVSTDPRVRERVSVDGSKMSPVILELLPLGLADVVAFPTNATQIAACVAAAVTHGVPVTPRGKGTGNYGQAIPMEGGLVLDLTRARAIVEIGDGWVTAEAGATMVAIEAAARETGQELWMYPSTAQSTIGGFLSGGSGGTGTIVHGANHQGFVVALDVVHALPGASLVHVEGEAAQAYVHNYGTAGILARVTVRLEPLQDWRGFYASFDDQHAAFRVLRDLGRLTPAPRLVSADPAPIAEALPPDDALPPGRASLRAILDPGAVEAATTLVLEAGGTVEDLRDGPQASLKLSVLSYNHPVEWLQTSDPGTYVHLEVGGEALVDRLDEVQATIPGGLLHLEAGHTVPIGMLAGVYEGPERLASVIAALGALGVGVHNPHQWNVDFEVERTVALAAVTDPSGLLNPGKLDPDYAGPRKGAIR
ncbi:FAD-binding oxidoreductase [Cellulomonas sp. URHD0024]|uniref:FAD-binding oxidoreductase n=1 Tax=Cellulomonas sp. URHD0024 TaxID=1302620 RepID=UPI000408DE80|nr:FAD-binding oxidoreductase [Cellulomonas sp. URHD0024]